MEPMSSAILASERSAPGEVAAGAASRDRYCLTPISAILLAASSFFALGTWADYDVYWHLADGRLSANGHFPSPDRFSWSAAGQRVNLNSVRFDQAIYRIWDWFGGNGLSVISGVLMIAAILPVALFLGRLRLKVWWEALALLGVIVAVLPYEGLRPHLIGASALGFIALITERPFGARKALGAGVLLSIWLNMHGSFIFGFALLGLAAASWTLIRDYRAAASAIVALAIGFASTALSPYGFSLWLMPLRVTANNELQLYNLDWHPLRPFTIGYLPMALLILAAVALGIWRLSDPRALAAMLFILPTIQYARFTPLTAPILMMVVMERFVARRPTLRLPLAGWLLDGKARMRVRVASAALLLAGFGALALTQSRPLDQATHLAYPTAAVSQLMKCGAPAPVWNDYNWGGYLTWQSNGALLVGMDGRAETLYDGDTLNRYFRVLDARSGWEQIVQSSPVQYSLVMADADAKIDQLPGWRLVYVDSTAVIAARDGAPWACGT
jgi:hypothetical protein